MSAQEAGKSVENYFPKAPIDIKINDLAQEPTPLRLIKFQKYIQQCAINIPIKGTTLGLLGAVIEDTDYKTVNNNVSWAPPTAPGPSPTMQPAPASVATRSATEDATAAAAAAAANETNRILQFQQATRDHDKLINTWTHYQGALTALRNLIINNIDEDYIAEHNNMLTGFRLVTPATLLNHIKANYGDVEPLQLKENEATLDAPWDATTPIVTLYKRIEDCKLFAEAGDEPLSDKKLLRAALLAIEATGLYNLACDTWTEKPSTTKTWTNFKIFFSKESKKVKHHTTGSLGIQDATANALLQLNDAFAQQQQQIMQLASNERQPLTEIPIGNDNIINETDHNINNINDQTIELKALKEQVQALMATINNNTNDSNSNNDTRNNRNNSSGNNNNNGENAPSKSRQATKNADVRAQGYDKEGYAITYCHTHGTSRNLTHNSCSCKYPGESHKKAATLSNKMGGSCKVNQKATT